MPTSVPFRPLPDRAFVDDVSLPDSGEVGFRPLPSEPLGTGGIPETFRSSAPAGPGQPSPGRRPFLTPPDEATETDLGNAVGGMLDAAGEFGASLPQRFGADPVLALGKGIIGLGEAAVGAVDLGLAAHQAGRPGRKLSLGKTLEDAAGWNPAVAKAFLDEFMSKAQQRGQDAVDDAEGVLETTVAALSHPQVLFTSAVESLPSMLAGGAVGRAATLAGARVAAGAIGEGLVSAGATAEGIRQQSPDRVLSSDQAAIAAGSGAAVAGFGRLGAAAAKHLGVIDFESALAAASADPRAMRGFVSQVLLGAVEEGLVEELPQSVIEQAAQNLATGRPIAEGIDKAIVMGALVGGMMGGGTQIGARVFGPRGADRQTDVGGQEAAAPGDPVGGPPVMPGDPVSTLPPDTVTDLQAAGYDDATIQGLTLVDAQEILRGGPVAPQAATGMAALAGATTDPAVMGEVVRSVDNDPALRAKRDEMIAAVRQEPADEPMAESPTDDEPPAEPPMDAGPREPLPPTPQPEAPSGMAALASDEPATALPRTETPAEEPSEALDDFDAEVAAIMAELAASQGGTPTIEVVDPESAPTTENASGESAASVEAQSRQDGMKARGERFMVYDRAGNGRPLIGPEAVDYAPAKGETYGIEGPDGFRVLTDNGGKVPSKAAPKNAMDLIPALSPPPRATESQESVASRRATFEKTYRDGLREFMKYSPSEAGHRVWAERLGDLQDAHPEWTAEIDAAIENERPTTPAEAPAEATSAATITRNRDKGSVEVKFPGKPAADVLANLKRSGFRWAKTTKTWYSKAPNAWEVAHKLTGQEMPALDTSAKSAPYKVDDHVDYRGDRHHVVSVSSTNPKMIGIRAQGSDSRLIEINADHVKPWVSRAAAPAAEPTTRGTEIRDSLRDGTVTATSDTEPVTKKPGEAPARFKLRDWVTADEGTGVIIEVSADGERVRIDLDNSGRPSKWINASRVTPGKGKMPTGAPVSWAHGGVSTPAATSKDAQSEEDARHAEEARRHKEQSARYRAPQPPGAVEKARAAGAQAFSEGQPARVPMPYVATKALGEAWQSGWTAANLAAPVEDAPQTAEAQGFKVEGFINTAPEPGSKAERLANLKKKRAKAGAEIDAALADVRKAVKKAGSTLNSGVPVDVEVVKATLRLVRGYLAAGIVEAEDAWFLFQDEAADIAARAKQAFEIAWRRATGDAVTLSEVSDVEARDRGASTDASADAGEQPQPDRTGPDGEPSSGARADGRSGGDSIGPEPGSGAGAVDARVGATGRGRRAARDTGADYRLVDDDEIGAGGVETKIKGNIAAITLLKELEAENRPATADEQLVLAKYVGWGQLSAAFQWDNKHYATIRELLTPDEYTSARASTDNAHYTAIPVVRAMWTAVQRLGFSSGRVLEPSMGVGNFYGAMPDALRGSTKRMGIELDSISGRIATKLYPETSVKVQGFEAATIPDGFFDLVISNVPFGDYLVHDPAFKGRPKALRESVHDYFLVKALDKVRPGGMVVIITSRYTLDKVDSTVRKWVASKADLIGAVRLPDTAFRANAGTDVVTDVLVLRRRADGEAPGGESFQSLGDSGVVTAYDKQPIRVNEYFVRHPDHVVGDLTADAKMWRAGGLNVKFKGDAAAFQQALAEAFATLPENVYTDRPTPKAVTEEARRESVPAPDHVKDNAFAEQDGKLWVKQGAELVSVDDLPAETKARIRGMMKVRGAVRDTMALMLSPEATDVQIAASQKTLNATYDKFVAKHGPIGSRANVAAFDEDPDKPLLLSLEDWSKGKDQAPAKAAIFAKRILSPRKPVEKAGTAKEALLASLNNVGRVDLALMARLVGKPEIDVLRELAGLVYLTPGHQVVTADEYLSGNVRQKLRDAEAAAAVDPRFEANVQALKAVQPADLVPGDIKVSIGAPWVSPKDYVSFLTHLIGGAANGFAVTYAEPLAAWAVRYHGRTSGPATTENEQQFGTPDFTAVQLAELAMNMKLPTVRKTVGDEVVVDQEATLAARVAQERIKEEFGKWIWADQGRAERLATVYNERYNSFRDRTFDGSHLTLDGMSAEITLRPTQANAIWRTLQSPSTGLGHVVGAGKTFTMIGAALEMRRLGIARKPVIVVPNHLVSYWGKEVLRMYPTANVLVATKDEFAAGERQRFMSRIATGDWDAVIVAHRSFELLPVSDETFNEYVQELIAEMEAAIAEAVEQSGKKSPTVKQLEKAKKRLTARLRDLRNAESKDRTINFDDLGVDAVFVDEAHMFKNLEYASKMDRVAGMAQSFSDRAFDMFMKARMVQRGTGRVVFATGTPLSNTMGEMFTMTRFLTPELMKQMGVASFDGWANLFGRIVASHELAPEGTGYRVRSRFAQFVNVPELMTMFKASWDIVTAQQAKLPRPKVKGGKPEVVSVPASAALKRLVQDLAVRAAAIRGESVTDKDGRTYTPKKPDPSEDNMLKVTGDGRKAALDMRLLGYGSPADASAKVKAAVERIATIYKANDHRAGTQLVFSDMGTPKKGDGFNLYADIRDRLVKAGIPKAQIAFIHSAKSDADKQALYDKVNAGEIRVLIGSTEKMGAGMNVQQRLVALHHLDAPWRPSDIEQREGRILRQGNLFYIDDPEGFEVEILRYVTEGSFDGYSWQTLESKARFIDQVMRGDATAREMDDLEGGALTYAEVKAIASGNPAVLDKVKVDTEVRKLEALAAQHQRQMFQTRQERASYESSANVARATAARYRDIAAAFSRPESFAMTIDGRNFDDREAAEQALHARLESWSDLADTPIGAYGGLTIFASARIASRSHVIDLAIGTAHDRAVTVQTHTPRGIESAVADLEDRARRRDEEAATRDQRADELGAFAAGEFEGLERLAELRKEQARLAALLNLDAAGQAREGAAVVGDGDAEATTDDDGDEPRPRGGGRGGRASIGTYVQASPPTTVKLLPSGGALTATRPTGEGLFPELVAFVEEITGKSPAVVERFRNRLARGYFKGGNILLRSDLFTRANRAQLAATLAHEIGHLVDWLPDFDDRRGNLLGHLRSLHRFMKHTYTSAADVKKVKNADVKAELLALSKAWRPYPSNPTPSHVKYRESPQELYADAISVLLNDPKRVETEAPIFFKEFHAELDRKPEVKAAYLGLIDAMSMTSEELSDRRIARARNAYQEGNQKTLDVAIMKHEERKLRRANLAMRLRIDYVDKNSAVIKMVTDAQARGQHVPIDDDPRYMLEEREHIGALGKVWVEEHVQPVQAALEDAGITWENFGLALMYERIIGGDRSEMANPGGISADEARTDYSRIVNAMTPAQRAVLNEQLQAFRAAVKTQAENGYDAGLYTDEQIKQVRDNDFYGTFQTVDHIADGVSSSMIRAIGTTKAVRNVADATILKTLVTIRAAEHNRVKRDAFAWMLKNAPPGSVVAAKQQWDANARSLKPAPPPKGSALKLIEWKENGKWRGAWTDPYVAAAFEQHSVGYLNGVLQALQWANGTIFRPLFTTYNVGFMAFNAGRDFLRFWKATPNLTLRRALKRYYEAVPMARARAKVFGYRGDPSKMDAEKQSVLARVREAEKARILDVTLSELMGIDDLEPTAIEQIMAEAGVQTYATERNRLRRSLDWLRDVGDFIETLPKAAAIIELTSDGRTIAELEANERSFIRRKVGSPDFKQGGRERAWMNNVFLYSNAILQGTRSDLETATEPTTAWGYWVKTVALNVLPKLATFSLIALASGGGDDNEDDLGDILAGVSEYDLTNYLVVPLGRDAKGKAIVLRVPQDDFGRLIGGLTWKAMGFARGDRDFATALAQIVHYTSGQGPGMTPALTAPADLVSFFSGKNVFDDFRSRPVFSQEDMDAGIVARAPKFFAYEWNQVGGSIVWRLNETSSVERQRGTLETILNAPFVSNTVGRFLKVTDQGYRERIDARMATARQTGALSNRAERKAVADVTDAIREMAPPMQKAAIERESKRIAKQVHAGAAKASMSAQERDIKRKLTISVRMGATDVYVDKLLVARSNAEKAEILKEARRAMAPDKYGRWMTLVQGEGILSEAMVKTAKELR